MVITLSAPGLLGPQCLDRLKCGCPPRRRDAEEQSGGEGGRDSDGDSQERGRAGPPHDADEEDKSERDAQPDRGPEQANERGLNKKLIQDVAAPSAERLTQPNL